MKGGNWKIEENTNWSTFMYVIFLYKSLSKCRHSRYINKPYVGLCKYWTWAYSNWLHKQYIYDINNFIIFWLILHDIWYRTLLSVHTLLVFTSIFVIYFFVITKFVDLTENKTAKWRQYHEIYQFSEKFRIFPCQQRNLAKKNKPIIFTITSTHSNRYKFYK